ncbi:MAG: aminotransferase class V-fold PLP-dependent enzyme [Rhodospirillales bacterium]|nr:aminotransferase class V-fold PLP-dependent enzyme [Rhodospirillales bacterium]
MSSSLPPLGDQRHLFEIEDGTVFLNAASKSMLLRASVQAGQVGAAAKGQPWKIDEPARYVQADDIRERFAGLIGASGDDIAIQPAASYGVATAAKNLTAKPGERILVIEGQFPSNVYAWQRLAEKTGAVVSTVPWPGDGDWTQAVLDMIDDDVAIAALPPCHWTDGSLVDLEKIAPKLRDAGAVFLIDATQWVGAIPIDVKALRADYLVCAAYKWLLGPYGLSFMYASPHMQDGLPLEDHLFNHGGVDSITGGLGYPEGFTKGARRYDAGEYLSLITLPMIQVALKQLQEWTPARVSEAIAPITSRIAEGAEDLGFDIAPKAFRTPHILGIRRKDGFPADIAARLAAENVHVSSRGGAVRVSPHLCNDLKDADEFLMRIGAVLYKT